MTNWQAFESYPLSLLKYSLSIVHTHLKYIGEGKSIQFPIQSVMLNSLFLIPFPIQIAYLRQPLVLMFLINVRIF